jgi:hypothetical protein
MRYDELYPSGTWFAAVVSILRISRSVEQVVRTLQTAARNILSIDWPIFTNFIRV